MPEEHIVRVFGNRVVRRICEPKRDDVDRRVEKTA
jgi:hypothetical protein